MELEGFGISNFRSFDNDGVFLKNLKKVNVIIGKNNCGKSNILRFLQLINENAKNLEKFPFDIANQFRRNGREPIIKIPITGEEIIVNREKLKETRDFDYKSFEANTYLFEYSIRRQKVTLPKEITELTDKQLLLLQSTYGSADKNTLIKRIEHDWNRKLSLIIRDTFVDLIYIPHFRVIQEGHSFGDSNSSINGSNIIGEMFKMQNPTIGNESLKQKFNLIQSFVRELINKPTLSIEIPHTKSEIILTIDDNRLPLESFGTGIHQLVLLCSTLVIHENSIVCIEEPEIHLHPELQRKFIDFLHTTKNTYFITTHSNVFLDSKQNTTIYHVQNDGYKSIVNESVSNEKTLSILNDLGYHSSDLLQSNGIIWVEGPSDRTYLLKWIRLLKPEYLEGLHFSIMFYGGRLLSHLSFEKEKTITELIPLLELNRNAFLIMDRDGFSNQSQLNKTKKRVIEEIGDKTYWVTKGREIENYLSAKSVSNWLGKEIPSIDENIRFEETVLKNGKIHYERAKSKYAKEITSFINTNDLNVLDLRQKMKLLLNSIENWNK